MLDNILVAILMSLPFLIFLGLKYMAYQKQKRMEAAEEINSILNKYAHPQKNSSQLNEESSTSKTDNQKAA